MLLIIIYIICRKKNIYMSTICICNLQFGFESSRFCGKIDVLKKWARDQLTPFGPVPASQSPGLQEGDPLWRRGPLTVADIENAARTQSPSIAEEVAEEARGRWWERMAQCVLTSSSLGAPSCEERRRKVAALLLLRCWRPVALAAATLLQQPAAAPRPPPESQAMTTGSRDRNWTPHDPSQPVDPPPLFRWRNSASGTLSNTLEIARRNASCKRQFFHMCPNFFGKDAGI